MADSQPGMYVVFDGPPSHETGRFVEVEDGHGHGVECGAGWREREDGWWELGPFLSVDVVKDALRAIRAECVSGRAEMAEVDAQWIKLLGRSPDAPWLAFPRPNAAETKEYAVLAEACEPGYYGDEPLGTCIIHGDYWTDDCARCGR